MLSIALNFALVQSALAEGVPSKKPALQLKGSPEILLNVSPDRAAPVVAASSQLIRPGEGYATVKYLIGDTDYDINDVRTVLQYMGQALPSQFGNTEGAYTITLTISDSVRGTVLVKEPIVSFQWSKARPFFFVEQTTNEVRRTNWSGTMLSQVPVKQGKQSVKLEVEILFQENKSLDFELLKKTAKTYSAGGLASFFPLPAVTAPIIESVAELLQTFFAGSKKKVLADQFELEFRASQPEIKIPMKFKTREGGELTVPIRINVETTPSRLTESVNNGKFSSGSISESVFQTTEVSIGEKSLTVLELLQSSDMPRFKPARMLLDALANGGTYGKDPAKKEDDLAFRCGELYDALHSFVSKYDARAMFWAFLQKYGESVNKQACLGNRAAELKAVGLQP